MSNKEKNLETLHEIRSMMDRSSRFISLSGWSGIAAGVSALTGAWLAKQKVNSYHAPSLGQSEVCPDCLRNELLMIAAVVLLVALTGAILFTYRKGRKEGIDLWGNAAKRLMWNTVMPMVVGGFLIWKMIALNQFELIAPASLIFYGLGLVNGSKFTIGEVRYLGYAILVTGIVNLFLIDYGIECWAFGFGILHILYGFTMWQKYGRRKDANT